MNEARKSAKQKRRERRKAKKLQRRTVDLKGVVLPGDTAMRIRSGFIEPVAAAKETKNTVKIWGYIGSERDVTADSFDEELKKYAGEDVEISINSGGGSVFDSIAMYNSLAGHEGRVTIRIMGVAASGATLVAMAGDEIHIAENALFMVHKARGGVYGTAAEIRQYIDMMQRANEILAITYRARTGIAADELDEMLSKDTWLTAEEALDLGFVDVVDETVKVTPHIQPGVEAALEDVKTTLGVTRAIEALQRLAASVSTPPVTQTPHSQGSDMTFKQWLKAKNVDESTLSAEVRTLLKSQWQAEIQASASSATEGGGSNTDPDAAAGTAGSGSGVSAATSNVATAAGGDGASLFGEEDIARMNQRRAANLNRVSAIEAHALEHGQCQVPINASGEYDPDSETQVPLAAHAIEAGWSLNMYRLAHNRQRSPQAIGATGFQNDSADFDQDVIEAAIATSLGIPADITTEDGNQVPILATGMPSERREQVLNAANSERFRGFGLSEAMGAICAMAGKPYHGTLRSEAHWRHYVQCQRELLAAGGGSSTISLPGVLGNVANKSLLMAYQAVAVRWPRIARTTSNRDFKATTMYQITLDGAFRKTGPDGKMQHGRIHEASYTNQLDTYGRKLTLNRQMRVNDDLSAFQQVPQQMGRGGALALEAEVFSLLLANTGSFFSAGNENLVTGAALGIAGMTSARKNFGHHVDQYGNPILADPYTLLVPTALMDDADVLLESRMKITGENSTQGERNPHRGKIRGGFIDSAYLDNTNIRNPEGNALTGQSATAWYLFADPAVLAAMFVSFLNGQQTPIIQSDNGTFDNDGITVEGYFDFGVSFGDPAGATKCTP